MFETGIYGQPTALLATPCPQTVGMKAAAAAM